MEKTIISKKMSEEELGEIKNVIVFRKKISGKIDFAKELQKKYKNADIYFVLGKSEKPYILVEKEDDLVKSVNYNYIYEKLEDRARGVFRDYITNFSGDEPASAVAKELGVTRQRVYQIRKTLRELEK